MKTLEVHEAAVFTMPSATPNRSVFWRKGVTRVMYLDPLQGLSKLGAQCSVSPPTLSRIRSNLQEKRGQQVQSKEQPMKDTETAKAGERSLQVSGFFQTTESCKRQSNFIYTALNRKRSPKSLTEDSRPRQNVHNEYKPDVGHDICINER